MENQTYNYKWYQENASEYKKLYKQDFDLKNKYFLLAVGGTVAILIPLLEKFGDIVKIFLLIEIALLIILGFLVLYSLLKEVEVHEKYIENYEKVYQEYGEEEITEENWIEASKKLNDNKFYEESIKNEKNIKKFFKVIIGYTIFLLVIIIGKETQGVVNKMQLEKNNSKQSEIELHLEGVKPLLIKKIVPKKNIEEQNKTEKNEIKKN